MIAKETEGKVVFEMPDEVEKMGYSRATKARMESKKIQELGWSASNDIHQGTKKTLQILGEQ